MLFFKKIFSFMSSKIDLKGVNEVLKGKGTTRLITDNNADSWLTQSIRPILALSSVGAMFYVLTSSNEIPTEIELVVFSVFSDIIKFYFIARTTEKIIKMLIDRVK